MVDSALWTVAALFVVDAALGVWLGSMVFFSFVGAPTVFAVLERDAAGRVVNATFPRYYLFGVALGGVALAGGVALFLGYARVWALPTLTLTLVDVALSAYARWRLIPKMEAAGEGAFERYHRTSVLLNGAAMVAVGLALLAAHAGTAVGVGLSAGTL